MLKKIVVPIIALSALILGIYNVINSSKKDKTGYVLLNTVYEKFDMSKEMEGKITAVEDKRNEVLDSLKFVVLRAEKAGSPDLEFAKQNYFYKQQEFEKSNEQVKGQLDEQVWKQINQYITEYGKEKGYSYIYGANGNGSIMYVDPSGDITEDVAVYINKRYKGQK